MGILNLIPFSLLLGVLLFLVYWVQAFFILYHLVRFGIGAQPKIVALLFFMGSIVLFMATTFAYSQVDLSSAISRAREQFNKPIQLDLPKVNYPR